MTGRGTGGKTLRDMPKQAPEGAEQVRGTFARLARANHLPLAALLVAVALIVGYDSPMMRRALLAAGGGSSVSQPNPSLVPPLRGAYYFPWYDEAWDSGIYTPATHYTPTLGAYYDQNTDPVINQHVAWALEANLDVLIPTWRGKPDGTGISATTFAGDGGTHTDAKIVRIMDAARWSSLKVAMLYEVEAYANPTQAEIEAEFTWLAANRFTYPTYLYVDGRPVIFVYTGADHSDALAQKYSDATSGFTTAYVMMQTQTDPSAATPQPDGWFTFSNDRTSAVSNSYNVCPGYWLFSDANPVTTRDLATWQANVASMIASGADWQLINSFNEWAEGSQIEPSTELGTDYLDALAP